jgi:hypothetical protein
MRNAVDFDDRSVGKANAATVMRTAGCLPVEARASSNDPLNLTENAPSSVSACRGWHSARRAPAEGSAAAQRSRIALWNGRVRGSSLVSFPNPANDQDGDASTGAGLGPQS